MAMYIKLYRKEDGSWEGNEKIDLKKLWYLRANGEMVDIEDCKFDLHGNRKFEKYSLGDRWED